MMAEIVTIKVAPGKTFLAREWAAKSAAYVKKASASWQVSVFEPITGGGDSEIVLVIKFPSLAEFEDHMNRRRDDPSWLSIVKEGRESDWWGGFTRQFFRVSE